MLRHHSERPVAPDALAVKSSPSFGPCLLVPSAGLAVFRYPTVWMNDDTSNNPYPIDAICISKHNGPDWHMLVVPLALPSWVMSLLVNSYKSYIRLQMNISPTGKDCVLYKFSFNTIKMLSELRKYIIFTCLLLAI